MYCGVYFVFFDLIKCEDENMVCEVFNILVEFGFLSIGDIVILMYGDVMEIIGVINIMKIVIV